MLRRRSIRLRIIVLVLVPVMGLIGLYAEVLNLTLGKVLTLRQEAAIRQLVALPVADVQRQLANERGFALQYLASPGHGDLKLLLGQEKTTDAAVRRFGAAVQTALNSSPAQKERQAFLLWQGHLKKLGDLRTSVASLGLSKIDAAGAYSTVLEEGDNVLNQAILPVLTGPLGLQATDLLTMAKAAQALGEESDLLRGDLTARSFPPEDLMLVNQLAVLRQELWSQTLPDLDPVLRDNFTTLIPQSAVSQLASLEGKATSGPPGAAQISPQAWTSAASAYRQGFRSALLKGTAALATEATNQAKHLVRNLLVIAGIGLFAILAAVAVGIILGRGLIRQLNDLRQSAVRLSSEQLPAAISRLRSGEEVDVGAEVPRLEPGGDEIGQVSEAFNAAARTAIAAAVDEIKIRQGVNDVFR
ncbi:MAG TPA: nitrate- and nitrite sensing domain-containing protein, partial [Streptosporangiaceae bacterium]|nr:nitrate- and nitrite sensing domain-containing protein [Streptosporangiaceae bacterium]